VVVCADALKGIAAPSTMTAARVMSRTAAIDGFAFIVFSR
jgi:hypothetical protein